MIHLDSFLAGDSERSIQWREDFIASYVERCIPRQGYCVEQIPGRLPKGCIASHYRTHAGAEVDFVIERPDGSILATEPIPTAPGEKASHRHPELDHLE